LFSSQDGHLEDFRSWIKDGLKRMIDKEMEGKSDTNTNNKLYLEVLQHLRKCKSASDQVQNASIIPVLDRINVCKKRDDKFSPYNVSPDYISHSI
jgi:hypothetical protein